MNCHFEEEKKKKKVSRLKHSLIRKDLRGYSDDFSETMLLFFNALMGRKT